MGIIDENEKKNNSPSMTIALPPLVPMSMPRYRGVESIAEAKRATERLARCELERKGVRLIDANDDAKNVNVVFFFFFAAPRTPVPRLALPVQLQQQREEVVTEARDQPNCDGERAPAPAAAVAAASGMRRERREREK